MAGRNWKRAAHVPTLIILQLVFIILFAIFVVYNPEDSTYHEKDSKVKAKERMEDYPRKITTLIISNLI